MGNFDDKNIIVEIELRENLTDPRYVEFMKGWDFTYQDLEVFEKNTGLLYTPMSHRIVSFFTEYKDGLLLPDRWGGYEPLKHDFKKEELLTCVDYLSYPASELLLKKRRKFDAVIKNRYHALIFEGSGKNIGPVIVPKRILPEYMTDIYFFFAKQRKIDMDFLKQLLRDFCDYLQTDTDRAYIYDMEDKTILFDLFHPENIGKKHWKDCYSY